jgi:hypothetical protein
MNDLLLIPCALPLVLFIHKTFGLRKADSFPKIFEVILHLVIWSIYCEWIGPIIQNKGIADPLDVLAYWVGGLLSWALWNWRSSNPQAHPSRIFSA